MITEYFPAQGYKLYVGSKLVSSEGVLNVAAKFITLDIESRL